MNLRDYSKPVRPPRTSKNPKETPVYWTKIIQSLSISQDNAEKDRYKALLEKEFSESDRLLGRLVKAHQEKLTRTMHAFRKTSANLKSSIVVCQDMKEKLTRCKTLLYCRRDDLKRLWLEVVEHKRVMHMLKEIENVMEVPEKVEAYLKARMYLDATQLLVSSILLFEESLEGIDALKELKTELYAKREELHSILVKELHMLLYLSASNHILKRFKRHGSGRLRHNAMSAGLKNAGDSRDLSSSTSTTVLNNSLCHSFTSAEDTSFSEVEETTQSSISNLVECVSLLQRIPETVEILKEKCQQELLSIVRRTAQHVAETSQNIPFTYQQSYLGTVQNKEQQYLLLDLLELIFEQFKYVTHNHKSLLKNLQQRKTESDNGCEMADFIFFLWSKVQAVLEIFVGEYVEILNLEISATQASAPSSFSKVPSAVDISSFFLRKRNQKFKNYSLFKFDSSSHAISMKTYLQEQKEALKEKGEIDAFDSETQVFICPPATKNIITIFRPLTKFIMEIAEELNVEAGANCPINTFINRCVKVFLGQITVEVNHVIESASKSLDNWRIVSDSELLKKAGVDTYLLHSAVYIDNSVQELKELIFALPLYSTHFLNIICSMLQSYREFCQAAYSSLIQTHSEDKRSISSSWARDKDISRLLRSLPNWTNLKEKDLPDFEESPEEVRLRNKKESEILIANFTGDTVIPQHEILLDPTNLHNLALLHESMEWLNSSILTFASSLPKHPCNQSLPNLQDVDEDDLDPIPDVTIDSLTKLANDYGTLADTCLLVLHLEVRVHCVYYLQNLAIQGCYAARLDNQEPDPEITKLNTDLSKIDESLQCVLKPCNVKYVFEGLGELIATILINSTNKIKRINENGVKKINRNIFALQQNLTGITMFREVALDRARQYFDLLNHSPEEILNLIVENGPQFQELEYAAIFHLLQRSQPGSDSSVLTTHLERLHQILNEVAVSV